MSSLVTVLIPAYNEEASIGKVIDEIRAANCDCRIVVGNNCSTDNTALICREKEVDKVLLIPEKGKGNVMRELFRHIETPYAVMVDADYTYPISECLIGIIYLLKRKYDVVICERRLLENGSMSRVNEFGNRALSAIATIVYQHRVGDVCTGLWGWRREVIASFVPKSKGFTLEAELFGYAVKNKQRIRRTFIGYRARLENSEAKLKILDGFKIGMFLLRNRI